MVAPGIGCKVLPSPVSPSRPCAPSCTVWSNGERLDRHLEGVLGVSLVRRQGPSSHGERCCRSRATAIDQKEEERNRHRKENLMHYLCLAYYDEEKFETLSGPELEAIMKECRPHDEELRRGGHLVVTGSLQPARSTTTLRPRKGKVAITDGPFIESKEQVGGFFIIEARDLNEAIRVASKQPAALMNE